MVVIKRSSGFTYECSYCGATNEYIEWGGTCECGVEWINRKDDKDFYWGSEMKYNNIDNILESKRK